MVTEREHKVCFIVPYSANTVPGQRFRFEQYLELLVKNGFSVNVYPFLSMSSNRILYQKGHFVQKLAVLARGLLRRGIQMVKAYSSSVIFIYREAAPFGPPIFEWFIFNILKKKVIYDFDDAIWCTDRENESILLQTLKWRSKVAYLCKRSTLIICGNEYLATFARSRNPRVKIIPTTIDTDKYVPYYQIDTRQVTIGWSGSISTIAYFNYAIPALKKIRLKYGEKVAFKVIGDGDYTEAELGIKGIPWKSETETEDLSKITIGIMPLPDDQWTRGKCGLKALQYMAMGIPTIVSPVGVNSIIIEDGKNGFLASSIEDWVEKLSLLIEQPALRESMGREGRKSVEEYYSIKSQQQHYLDAFRSMMQ